MTDDSNSGDERAALKMARDRLSNWHRRFKLDSLGYYIVGVFGTASATIATAIPNTYTPYDKISSAISAVCFAIIGFVQPDRMYNKFVKAWRILDDGYQDYLSGTIDIKELNKKVTEGEASLTNFEDNARPAPQRNPRGSPPIQKQRP